MALALAVRSKGAQELAKKTREKRSADADGLKDELGLAVSARRELGEQYEDEVVEALAERIETMIDERVQAAMGKSRKQSKSDAKAFLAVAMPTMGVGIPLLLFASMSAGPAGVYAVLAMIFLINALWFFRSR